MEYLRVEFPYFASGGAVVEPILEVGPLLFVASKLIRSGLAWLC
jgi:hypothetical protein